MSLARVKMGIVTFSTILALLDYADIFLTKQYVGMFHTKLDQEIITNIKRKNPVFVRSNAVKQSLIEYGRPSNRFSFGMGELRSWIVSRDEVILAGWPLSNAARNLMDALASALKALVVVLGSVWLVLGVPEFPLVWP